MKRIALLTFLAALSAAPALADYDAAMEAKEAAQRKAEQRDAARKKAEAERMRANAAAQYQRSAIGAEANGKSDAEVKVLYDRKMAGINKQAAEATRMTQGAGKIDPANMNLEDAQALAREMEKKYGKAQ